MAIVLVLLAAIAATTLDIVVTRTLSILVTLEALGAALIALTRLAAIRRKAKEVVGALITSFADHAGLAVALTRVLVAGGVVAAHGIAQTVLAAVARADVKITRLTLATIASNYVRFALALSGDLIAA